MQSVLASSTPEQQKSLVAELPQLTVKPGSNAKLDLSLHRAASISDRVTVDAGGALSTLRVTAVLVADKQPLALAAQRHTFREYAESAMTDYRGTYRIVGLPPGTYRVFISWHEGSYRFAGVWNGVASLEPNRAGVAELTVYALEALLAAEAQSIHLDEAEEQSGVDITVPLRLLHSVSGKVSVNGAPVGGVLLLLHRPDGTVQSANALSMPDGSYRFDLLPQGNYTVEARIKTAGAEDRKAPHATASAVLLDTDVLDANIDLHTAGQ